MVDGQIRASELLRSLADEVDGLWGDVDPDIRPVDDSAQWLALTLPALEKLGGIIMQLEAVRARLLMQQATLEDALENASRENGSA